MAKSSNPNNSAKLEPKAPISNEPIENKSQGEDKAPEKKEKPKNETAPVVVEPGEPSEMVIKEIMVQKGVTREQAIHILKNPAK